MPVGEAFLCLKIRQGDDKRSPAPVRPVHRPAYKCVFFFPNSRHSACPVQINVKIRSPNTGFNPRNNTPTYMLHQSRKTWFPERC